MSGELSNKERIIQHGRPAMEVPFGLDEYRERLQRVQALMERDGIDLLYLGTPESMYYLSGYQAEWYQANSPKIWPPICGIAVHRERDRFILFDQIGEAILCRYTTVSTDTRYYTREEQHSAVEFIVSELKSEGWTGGTVGLEMGAYRPNRNVSQQFQDAFEATECSVVDATDLLREARRIKSPTELSYLRTAMQIAEIGMQAAWDTLEPGITEREAARMQREWLRERGVRDWFHLPFAWFGDRTAFRGIRLPLQFFPSGRKLEDGMPFILDCAPVVDGYMADIGYTGCLGKNPGFDQVQDDLAAHRQLILERVRARRPLRETYRAVDQLAARQGNENRHRKYPFHVIGHEVRQLPASARLRPVAFRFGLRGVRTLFRTAAVAASARRSRRWSPLWAGGRWSDHPPVPGLWAVEPHLGHGDVGAKFEEILVVTEDDAYWLDDDLPHVRRWRDRGIVAEPVGARPAEGERAGGGSVTSEPTEEVA
jgi:Xaa-Pro aminopeptidase